jgi:hypothetical protein
MYFHLLLITDEEASVIYRKEIGHDSSEESSSRDESEYEDSDDKEALALIDPCLQSRQKVLREKHPATQSTQRALDS